MQRHFPEILPEGISVHYKEGQFLFYEGHMPCGFYLIKKGTASFFQTCSNSSEIKEKNPDKLIGLVHLLSKTPHCCSCKAEEDVEVLFFPKQTVLNFLESKGG